MDLLDEDSQEGDIRLVVNEEFARRLNVLFRSLTPAIRLMRSDHVGNHLPILSRV